MQLRSRRSSLITLAFAAVGAVLFAVLIVVVLARPASATLTAAAPAQGATVDAAPTAISLTFTATVVQAHIEVSDADTPGAPALADRTVTQPMTVTKPGQHAVAYHVVTRDGGEVAGTLTFGIGPDAASQPAPVAPQLEETAGHRHGGPLDGMTIAVIAVNVVVLSVFGVLALHRKARRRAAARSANPTG